MKTLVPSLQRRTHSGLVFTVVVLTALHTYRIGSFFYTFIPASQGQEPAVHMIPGLGDFLVGLTAPLLAFWLWQGRGLVLWTTAIMWHSLALADLLVGLSLPFLLPSSSTGRPSSFLLYIPLFIIPLTHVVAVSLLSRRRSIITFYLPWLKEKHS